MKDYLSLEVKGLVDGAVTTPNENTYKAGRKPMFAFRFEDVLLFQLRAELYPRFARFDAKQR